MRRALPLLLTAIAGGVIAWYLLDRGPRPPASTPPPAASHGSAADVVTAHPPGQPLKPPGERAPDAPAAAMGAVIGPKPGAAFQLTLVEQPNPRYGPADWTESDRKYAADLEPVEVLDYDPALGRAARELAVFYSLHHAPAPTEALQFVVNNAGAAEWGMLQSFVTTTAQNPGAVRDRAAQLAQRLSDEGEGIRVGVGESYTVGPRPQRVIAIIVSRGGLYLDPFERHVAPGEQLVLSGSLPRGARAASAVTVGPELGFEDAPVQASGERFSVQLEAPGQPGAWLIELVATMASGPRPLAQLELQVGGRGLPDTFHGHWPPDESGIATTEDAEKTALALLNADRARNGLAPLRHDRDLARVARSHGKDMRDNGFFGHVSPTTGSVSDRIKALGYSASVSAENIASNSSLWDAQAGLYYSLGHRRNILSRDLTHVGVGVVSQAANRRRQWIVTQVFARPVEVVQPDDARQRVRAHLSEAIRDAGLTPPEPSSALDGAAQAEADAGDATPRGALDRAAGELRGGYAAVLRVADLARVPIPQRLLANQASAIGVGVAQDVAADPPNITVVVVVGH